MLNPGEGTQRDAQLDAEIADASAAVRKAAERLSSLELMKRLQTETGYVSIRRYRQGQNDEGDDFLDGEVARIRGPEDLRIRWGDRVEIHADTTLRCRVHVAGTEWGEVVLTLAPGCVGLSAHGIGYSFLVHLGTNALEEATRLSKNR